MAASRRVEPTERHRVSFAFWSSTLELDGAPKAMIDLVVPHALSAMTYAWVTR
jgi:hypothetical protein